MNFFDLIAHRRSVRSYQSDRPVSRDVLMNILEAGRVAPSAANRQPWKFIVVSRDDQLFKKLSECYAKDWFKSAPHILVVVGNTADAWTRNDGYNAVETDVTIAMDHMILAAAYQGVGTCWIAAFNNDVARATLGLSESEVVFAMTPLGYPEEGWEPRQGPVRKDIDQIVEFR